jgi:hypothetical protein
MNNRVIWLRVSYWVGALVDTIAALRMLFPQSADGVEYRYALSIGAALMLGWVFLLIWADRRPIERKGVLLLTLFPVVTGIILAEIYAYISGFMELERVLPTIIFLFGLCVLFAFSYWNAREIKLHQSGPAT